MSSSKRNTVFRNSGLLLLFAGCLLAVFLWKPGSVFPPGDLRVIGGPFSAGDILSAGLLLGAFVLLRLERARRVGLEAILGKQTAELEAQTATAVALACEVETARAEVQKFNEFLERGHAQERLSALRTSKSALLKEVVQRELTAVSLQASQSQLVLARDEIERASAEHTEDLERSNHELEQFAYVASHDLQEPLRAISGCVQILEKRYAAQLDPQGHELIAHTVQGVARLKELIEGLLAYSRVGRLGAEIEAVCVETALAGALGQLESAIKETAGEIEHGPLPTVCANASQLVQLLQNLIGNALKYRGAAAPRIKISALRADLMWIFAIRDNGIGIEPQYFDRVFSIFQRLHTRDEYPGTGIGLSLCRRIVEQAGGLIWIKSELGKGSTFYFTLPAILEPTGLA